MFAPSEIPVSCEPAAHVRDAVQDFWRQPSLKYDEMTRWALHEQTPRGLCKTRTYHQSAGVEVANPRKPIRTRRL